MNKQLRWITGVGCAALLGALTFSGGAVASKNAAGSKSALRSSISPIPAFNQADLDATPTSNWINVHGNSWNDQYSGLDQINTSNVSKLKAAWHTIVTIPTKGKPNFKGVLAESQASIYNGTMYMPDPKGNVYAMDATTGERLWYYHYTNPQHSTPLLQTTRGLAIGQGLVFMPEANDTVVALDQSTGRVKWQTTVGDWKTGAFFSAAPIYADGLLITGESGGDGGADCRQVAINAKTGKIVWTFHVIPTGSAVGANTWATPRTWLGGGALWSTPSVDQTLGMVYFATGNPVPYNGAYRGPGKELFTESIIALDLHTGKLKWYFQEVHHDNWDFDPAANGTQLEDVTINGVVHAGITQAGKTGWVYFLDRKTGKPILGINEKKVPQSAAQHTWPTQPIPVGQPFSNQCAPQSWKNWKAPDGQPVTVGCIYTPYNLTNYTATSPTALGGADFPPTSYDQQTQDLVICSKDASEAWKASPVDTAPGTLKPLGNFFQIDGLYAAKGSPAASPVGTIVAMNMTTNRVAWKVKFSPGDMCYSGIATTAGGLVFVGRNSGHFQAYDAKNGKLLWTSPELGAGVNAAPSVYAVGGREYVVVYAGGNSLVGAFGKPTVAGSNLYAFALPTAS